MLIVAIAMGIFLVAPPLAQRLALPGPIGLIVAGALVGPNGLNLLARDTTIVLLGTVGLLYLMFLAGAEIDLHGFRRYRNQSLAFGAATFLIPQGIGTGVGLALGFDVPTAILLASMFASHTLVAYPIALRFGIARTPAVTTAVGGTIITDTAALLVLAVVASSTRGTLDEAFWIRLVLLLSAYAVAVWYGLPRLARWFFRNQRTGATAEFVFILTTLFFGAYLAELAGVEAIVGAFLVGLALNRLIPEHGPLSNRIHFVGEAFFIPFFLLSIGMLVDVRILLGDLRAWEVMLAMTATVVATKWLAAMATRRMFGYSREQGWLIFGLSVPQAAATLAATLVGLEIGLFDEYVLNGAIMMILVTCIVGPWLVEKYGRQLALAGERRETAPSRAPQRILVPMSKPATAPALMDLALLIREPGSDEPIYPLTVVPAVDEASAEYVATAEKMLSHAVAYASGAAVPVVPLTRVDHNFASGIARGATEVRSSTLVVGWDAKRSPTAGIFGTVLDQVLELTKAQVLVAKLGHPLNTTERVVLLLPRGADRVAGYADSVRLLKQLASRLAATLEVHVIGDEPAAYRRQFDATRPPARATFERAEGWGGVLERLTRELRPDDLVVVVSARRGAVSWSPVLERLPARLAELAPESFIVLYPSERRAFGAGRPGATALLAASAARRVLLGVPRRGFEELLHELLATEFVTNRARLAEIADELIRLETQFTTEVRPGVVVPHARIAGLQEPLLFLATSAEGIEFPHASAPAELVFLLLTPPEPPEEHLHLLAELARLVSDPERVERIRDARSVESALAVVEQAMAPAGAVADGVERTGS